MCSHDVPLCDLSYAQIIKESAINRVGYTADLDVVEVPADIEWAMPVAHHRGRMEKINGTPLEENRAKGVSLAGEICKNYRREGLFFDEILDRARAGGT